MYFMYPVVFVCVLVSIVKLWNPPLWPPTSLRHPCLYNCDLFQNLLTSAGTFWLFASMCITNIIFTIAFIPETKGKTLEQIEATFRGTSGPWSPPTCQKTSHMSKTEEWQTLNVWSDWPSGHCVGTFKIFVKPNKLWSWLKHFLMISFLLQKQLNLIQSNMTAL